MHQTCGHLHNPYSWGQVSIPATHNQANVWPQNNYKNELIVYSFNPSINFYDRHNIDREDFYALQLHIS